MAPPVLASSIYILHDIYFSYKELKPQCANLRLIVIEELADHDLQYHEQASLLRDGPPHVSLCVRQIVNGDLIEPHEHKKITNAGDCMRPRNCRIVQARSYRASAGRGERDDARQSHRFKPRMDEDFRG